MGMGSQRALVTIGLVSVVVFGMLVNGGMTVYYLYRLRRPPPAYGPAGRVLADLRRTSMLWAVRNEFCFFLCQAARMAYTVYSLYVLYDGQTVASFLWGSLEREFVTLALVFLSLANIRSRHRAEVLRDELAGLATKSA